MSNKRYPEEFKIEAVRQITERGHKVADVATRLGVTSHSLYAWLKKYGPEAATYRDELAEKAEIQRLKKELKRVTEERDICVLREPPRVKYALIAEHLGLYSISLMCRVLGVSRDGFDRWRKRPVSQHRQRRLLMEEKVMETFEAFEACYGARRLTSELQALGYPCSTNYIADIMKSHNIKARNGKGFNYGHQSVTMVNVA